MFAYCLNNPAIGADPNGHRVDRVLPAWLDGGGGDVAAVGGGGGIVTLYLLSKIISYFTSTNKTDSKDAALKEISNSNEKLKSIAGSTPASPPDPNGNGEKHSYQEIRKNSQANKIAQECGYENAESFKDSIVGKGNGGKFNIAYDKVSSEIVLIKIQGKIVVPTEYLLQIPIY